jgi:hypothetical protein
MSLRRQQQGELIAQAKGSIRRLDDNNYVVNSQSGNGSLANLIKYSLCIGSCYFHHIEDQPLL